MPGTLPTPSGYEPPEENNPTLAPGVEPVQGYRLVKLLGNGGFGEVWRATAPGGFPVAMKFVLLSGQAGATELRSLDVLRELRHPNVLPVFGAWQTPWRLAVAMELADGTLLDRLHEVRAAGQEVGIPGPELLAHLRAAATGLDYLHASKLQHRDVKPQNLLLVGGAVKVADFGMVRALKESSSRHTSGMSVAYAPPEFFRERVSRHSDQYSLAVAYCELRGGRLPFNGNHASVMFGHLEGEPDLTTLPAAERKVVIRALAKEPGERWPSCREFAAAIERAMAGKASAAAIETPLPPPPPRRRGLAAALLGLAVLASGTGVALWPREGRPPAAGGESPAVVAAKPTPSAPEPTGKSPPPKPSPPTGTSDTDIQPKPKPKPPAAAPTPAPPADDGKAFKSRTTGMRFVRIPAGTFQMGSPESDSDADSDEKPPHEVTLTKDFYLGVHEVTRGQFRAFVEDSGYKTEADEQEFNWRKPGFEQTDDHPVAHVSWTDAVRFAEWLSKKDDQVYRLPTEAEWEYSCRGGATFKYHFGDDPAQLPRYANFNQSKSTTPVGQFLVNPFGLHDMHGNVWEWCADYYGSYPSNRATDPTGPTQGADRVFRGGCWSSSARNCRSADRSGFVPSDRSFYLGFRLARVPSGQ